MEDNIILEILIRLPVKSVARFKCTSNKWNQLISTDPYLRSRYRGSGGSPLLLGVFYNQSFYNSTPASEIRFTPSFDQEKKTPPTWLGLLGLDREEKSLNFAEQIVTSSNGFLLLCTQHNLEDSTYYICNPITRQSFSLPKPKKTVPIFNVCFICHGSNLDEHPRYKVVRILFPKPLNPSYNLTIDIFSSDDQTHTWKELTFTYSYQFKTCTRGIITESGNFYFPVTFTGTPESPGLIGYDLREHHSPHLEMIPLPGTIYETPYLTQFGQTNGDIVLAVFTDFQLKVWYLDEHNNKQWIPKYEVDMQWFAKGIRSENTQWVFFLENFHPFNPHLLLIQLLDRREQKGIVAWFNVQSRAFKVLPISNSYTNLGSFVPYVCLSWPPPLSLFQ